MGKYIIAGNWKMNKLPSETYDYVKEVVAATKDAKCEVVCCTPFVCLSEALRAAEGTHVKIGAETLYFAAFVIAAKSLATRDAPPIKPPSIFGFDISSSALEGFMLPPY